MQTKRNRFKFLRSAGALSLAAAITAGSVFTVAAAAAADNNSPAVTSEIDVEKMANSGVIISDADNLICNLFNSYNVTVEHNGDVKSVCLSKGTVEDALASVGVELAAGEVTEPALSAEITADTTVKVYEGKEIKITADGKTTAATVANGNVVDVLGELGYKLSDDDILNVDRESNIQDADKIVIKRVTYKTETETAEVNFDSVTENSDDVELGETKVKTEGKKGEKLITKKCKYIDGKLADTETVSETVTKEPVDKVTLVGTKGSNVSNPQGTFTDSNGSTVAYSAVYTGSATAYTAAAGALTATGVAAYEGGVAVNPNIIPYGSKLYITSTDGSVVYGYATAVDTGGALMAGTALVDCYYDTYSECVNFGRRNVNVYVVG